MKIKISLAIAAGLLLSSTAMADYIVNDASSSNAGGLDLVRGETSTRSGGSGVQTGTGFGGWDCTMTSGSNEAAEECWAESVLGGGTDLTLTSKTPSGDVTYYSTTPTGTDTLTDVFAFDLTSVGNPGFVVLKNSQNWALVENFANANWLAVTLSQLSLDKWNLGKDPLTISHYTGFNGGNTPVPEPGTLGLLGLGLLGMGIARRRRKLL